MFCAKLLILFGEQSAAVHRIRVVIRVFSKLNWFTCGKP